MRTNWAICAAVILTIGSTSSTYGAKTGQTCQAPTPATVDEVLNQIERQSGDIPYTEEVYHPALPVPKTNRGTLRAEPDGTLVRTQTWPKTTTSKVGRQFVTVIKKDGEPNLLPIPKEFTLWLSALRAFATGSALPPGTRSKLVDIGQPWKISMRTDDGSPEIFVVGCGKQVLSFETVQADQIRRIVHFNLP